MNTFQNISSPTTSTCHRGNHAGICLLVATLTLFLGSLLASGVTIRNTTNSTLNIAFCYKIPESRSTMSNIATGDHTTIVTPAQFYANGWQQVPPRSTKTFKKSMDSWTYVHVSPVKGVTPTIRRSKSGIHPKRFSQFHAPLHPREAFSFHFKNTDKNGTIRIGKRSRTIGYYAFLQNQRSLGFQNVPFKGCYSSETLTVSLPRGQGNRPPQARPIQRPQPVQTKAMKIRNMCHFAVTYNVNGTCFSLRPQESRIHRATGTNPTFTMNHDADPGAGRAHTKQRLAPGRQYTFLFAQGKRIQLMNF